MNKPQRIGLAALLALVILVVGGVSLTINRGNISESTKTITSISTATTTVTSTHTLVYNSTIISPVYYPELAERLEVMRQVGLVFDRINDYSGRDWVVFEANRWATLQNLTGDGYARQAALSASLMLEFIDSEVSGDKIDGAYNSLVYNSMAFQQRYSYSLSKLLEEVETRISPP